ncbi:MAG: ACT domain-containing protein [Planctomycetes bacterium]|nr:ACT domain-containing protein [Planctomycetota bacterium]
MTVTVTRTDVWAASIADQAGGLAGKLTPLADAGAQLEFVISRRAPEKPGTGVVFVAPLKGAAQLKAAKAAGFEKKANMHSLRIEGPDKPGLGAKLTSALAQAGINLRGLSAAALGKRYVMYLALDTAADASKAMRVLKGL